MVMHEAFIDTIERKTAVVGVIGLGYVGLPLILCFAEKGFTTIGLDIDGKKTAALMGGESYIRHIPSSRIQAAVEGGLFTATTDFSMAARCDAVLIAVPTPLNKNREPDVQYIVAACEAIAPHVRKGQLIVLESSTYPGTTDEVMIPILERGGLKVDRDFFAAFSPEREDPANKDFRTETISKVIGATSPQGLAAAEKLYGQVVVTTVPVSSTKAAEATKLVENIFRAVNIALVNELKTTFMKMGIDVWEVIDAAKTKPFGFMPFYPGPGLGGHCIPIDPFYLTWKAREFGVSTKFIELAGEINNAMPDFVVHRVMEVLNESGRSLKGARVLVLGLAYKANVDDMRESPTFHLFDRLEAGGAIVDYNDPYIPVITETREHARYTGRRSVPVAAGYDLMLIATAHDEYRSIDFSRFHIPIVDTRNVLKGTSPCFHKA